MRRPTVMFAAAAVFALAVGGEGLATEPWDPTALGIRGKVVFKNFSHFEETPTDNHNLRNEAILQVEWARRFTPWVDIKLVGDARDDGDLTKGVRFRIPDTARQRSNLNLVEAVIRVRQDPVELTVGKQVYAWGTGDAYNPTDNINPYDDLDPLDHEKLGVYSAALHATHGPTTVTLVLIHPEPRPPPVEPMDAAAANRGRGRSAIARDDLREHPVCGQSPYDISRLGSRAELLRRVR